MSDRSTSGFTSQVCSASRQRSGGPKEGLGSRKLRCAMGVDVGVVVYGVSRGGGRAVASARARVCVQAATGSAGWHTIAKLAWRGDANCGPPFAFYVLLLYDPANFSVRALSAVANG